MDRDHVVSNHQLVKEQSDDEGDLCLVPILSDDINVDLICSEIIDLVKQVDSEHLIQTEDSQRVMNRLVMIREDLGGTAEMYERIIESLKTNLLSGSVRITQEFTFVKLHVDVFLRENPGKLISRGLRSDLIK